MKSDWEGEELIIITGIYEQYDICISPNLSPHEREFQWGKWMILFSTVRRTKGIKKAHEIRVYIIFFLGGGELSYISYVCGALFLPSSLFQQ